MSGLRIAGLLEAVTSHAQVLGVFDRVNGHEPKNAPSHGITCAVWVDEIRPVLSSGLNITSARVVLTVRVYSQMLKDDPDRIDPHMVHAVDALLSAYNNDITLLDPATGIDMVRMVDVFGAEGADGLSAKAGYLTQDHIPFRVMTIRLPLVLNDAWPQGSS